MRKEVTRPAAARKWVAKGDKEEEEEGGDEMEAADGGETLSPVVPETAAGPRYDRPALLRMFGAMKVLEAQPLEAAAATDEQGQPLQLPDHEHRFSLTERVDEEETLTPAAARRALREQKKMEKLARRASESGISVPGEVSEEVPGTPSGSGQKIALSQELESGYPANMTPDMALLTYLHSMSYAAPTLPMYGAGYSPPQGFTTVMLRNIPNRYTRDMLIERLDQGYQGGYDFVYLPIDFNSKCNVGYAFINFRTPPSAQRFIQEFHGAKTKNCLPGFSSSKVCEVSYARVQGRDANMENLRDEKFIEKLSERPEWQPLFLDESGQEIPFSQTLGSGRRRSRAGSEASPKTGPAAPPAAPPSYMMPPYGVPGVPPMMYPPYPLASAAAQQDVTLASLLPYANSTTMLMLRSIPKDMTRAQFIECLNKSFKGAYDFLYMPGDDNGEGNKGYVFVNFRSAKKAGQFTKAFHEVKPSKCLGTAETEEEKACEVAAARMGNLEKSIRTLATNVAKSGTDERSAWYPLLFDPSGEATLFPLAQASAASMPPVPSQALDSRTLEKKMQKEAPKGEGGKEGGKKAKGKAREAEAPATQQPPAVPSQGYYPYPGYPSSYPPEAYGMSQVHAYAAAMAQVTHAHMRAAAAAHAGLLDPLAQAVSAAPGKPMDKELLDALRRQIEFYFSTDNLCKDMYLRSHMNSSGWTPVELIAQFNQVRKLKASVEDIMQALKDSTILEVDTATRYMRLRDAELRKTFAQAQVPTEYRGAAFAPMGRKASAAPST